MQDSAQKVRVVVGDDHPMFRDGVVRALSASGSIDVVAEADDGVAALELIRTHRPAVRGSTPASRTRTTSGGSSPPC